LSDVGELLRAARQKRHVSLEQVADATRIKVGYLEAIENGDYRLLPGPAYTSGFLRNYAQFLGLHPDDVVQDYRALQPQPPSVVKPATRVLASGYDRQNRARLLWALLALAVLLGGGYIIRQYSRNAHAYTPPLNVTPANLGSGISRPKAAPALSNIRLELRAVAPVWVRVTADGVRQFQGILRPNQHFRQWQGHRTIYVVTLDGAQLLVRYDGRNVGALAPQPGMIVKVATPGGWQTAA
jgi:transcriptional regulator with XRE-family HTH domain